MGLWNGAATVGNRNRTTTCDPAIPLLGIYPKEFKSGSQSDICTPMFTAALFSMMATEWSLTILNSQDVETIKMRDGWKNKYMVIYIQWNTTQPLKRMKFCKIRQNVSILRTSCYVEKASEWKTSTAWLPSIRYLK